MRRRVPAMVGLVFGLCLAVAAAGCSTDAGDASEASATGPAPAATGAGDGAGPESLVLRIGFSADLPAPTRPTMRRS